MLLVGWGFACLVDQRGHNLLQYRLSDTRPERASFAKMYSDAAPRPVAGISGSCLLARYLSSHTSSKRQLL
jgi:hypothetical protein